MARVDVARDRLLDAARSAKARGDWDSSYRLLREASERHETLPAEALWDLGLAAWWLGLARESLTVTEEAHQRLLAQGAVDQAATNAVDLAFMWSLRGDAAVGLGWLARARRLLDGRPESLAAGLLRHVDVSLALGASDLAAALAGAEQVQEMGERLDLPTLVSLGLMSQGLVHVRQGRLRRGFALLDEAMLPVLTDRVLPEYAGDIYCNLISICHDVVDLQRARQWTDATERWCERFSSAVVFVGVCRAHRVQLLLVEGALSEAEREARLVCRELADLNREAVAVAHYELGEVHRLRGELRDAEESYRRAADLGRAAEPGGSLLLLARGEVDAAWTRIQAALAEAAPAPFTRAPLLTALVEIALAASQLEAAARAADELEQVFHDYDSPGFRAWSRHARGAVLLAEGRPEQAVTALTEACHLYHETRERHAVARVRSLLGECYRAMGRPGPARDEEEAADLLLRELGAAPTEHRRRDGDGGPGGRPGGLTARELEVLRHVLDGASNREIATALFISEKTVGRHLSNIFTKLGVGSRTAAAAWAHRHMIGGSPDR